MTVRDYGDGVVQGVHKQTLFGEPTGSAEWTETYLMLEAAPALTFNFKAESIENLQIKLRYTSGEEELIGAESFVQGLDADSTTYSVSITVDPYKFSESYTVFFVENGVCDESYCITTSVNTILYQITQTEEEVPALIYRMYNYGESVCNYIRSR